jgi:hypothetical protein
MQILYSDAACLGAYIIQSTRYCLPNRCNLRFVCALNLRTPSELNHTRNLPGLSTYLSVNTLLHQNQTTKLEVEVE